MQELHEKNQAILRDLLEEAAATEHDPGTPDDWVGTYYRSGMDTDRIEELGIAPIADRLERIDAIASINDLRGVLVDFHRTGIGALFVAYVAPDFENATANLLYVGQGGLGLPDRDYYLRDDETSQQLLADYRTHVAAMLELLGDDPDTAAASADVVVDLETAIAEISYTNVQMRDVELTTNKHTIDDADALMPSLSIRTYLDGLGLGPASRAGLQQLLVGLVYSAVTVQVSMWVPVG